MRKVLPFVLVLALAGQLLAQSQPVGALDALALVPAEFLQAEHGGVVTYTNWPASYAGLGLDMPSAWADLATDAELMTALGALPPGVPAAIQSYARMAGTYPESIGIDLFDIAETVEFGEPPAQVLGLLGDFDLQAIQAAFLSRDYEITADAEFGLALCPLAGCDTGAATDIMGRDHSNPFGGDLGRRQPVLASDGYLISSPSASSMAAVAEAADGSRQSLASFAEVEALVLAASDTGELLTLTLVNPLLFLNSDFMFGQNAQSSEIEEEARERLEELSRLPGLPQFTLAAYAATIEAGHENGLVLLLYADRTSAEQAAEAIPVRLESLESARSGETYARYMSEFASGPHVSFGPAADSWVVTVRTSVPLVDIVNSDGQFTSRILRPYYPLYRQLIERDTRWLLPN